MNSFIHPNVLLIMVSYVVLFVSFYGWGRFASKIVKINLQLIPDYFFTTAWIGWASALLIFQILHLFMSLNWKINLFVYSLGMIGGIYGIIPHLRDIFRSKKTARHINIIPQVLFFFLILAVARWAVSRGMTAIANYDSGLYHFNAIRWINSYPIVFGLGNLHNRLAFNQSYFIYAASLNFPPYFSYAHIVANSFLFLLVFAEIAWRLYVLTRERNLFSSSVFSFLPYLFGLLIIAYVGLTSDGMSSPTPDLASMLIQTILYIWFVQIIDEARNHAFLDEKILSVSVVAATLITIKLSNLMFAASLTGICLVYAAFSTKERKAFIDKFFRAAIFLVAIFLVWVIRGICLSGYPLYPLAVGGLNVDWAIPAEKVRAEADLVYSWARMQGRDPRKVLGNWRWIRPWFFRVYRKYKVEIIYPILLTVTFGFVAFLISLFKKKSKLFYLNSIFFVPLIAGVLYWFFTAPDLRFAHALFFLLPLSAVMVFGACLYDLTGSFLYAILIAGVFVALALFLFQPIYSNINFSIERTVVPSSPLIAQKTDSGLMIYIPETGDQCWDSPLPCTPYFDPKLKLRVSGKIADGFSVR